MKRRILFSIIGVTFLVTFLVCFVLFFEHKRLLTRQFIQEAQLVLNSVDREYLQNNSYRLSLLATLAPFGIVSFDLGIHEFSEGEVDLRNNLLYYYSSDIGIAMDVTILNNKILSYFIILCIGGASAWLIMVLALYLFLFRFSVVPLMVLVQRIRSVMQHSEDAGEVYVGTEFDYLKVLLQKLVQRTRDYTEGLRGNINQSFSISKGFIREGGNTTKNVSELVHSSENFYTQIQSSFPILNQLHAALQGEGEQLQSIGDVLANMDAVEDEERRVWTIRRKLLMGIQQHIERGDVLNQNISGILHSLLKFMEDNIQNSSNIEFVFKNFNAAIENVGTVSKRMNMLAMNIAIEATRIGDEGKRMLPIASEMRALSKTSLKHTENIQTSFQNMYESAQKIHTVTTKSEKSFSALGEFLSNSIKNKKMLAHVFSQYLGNNNAHAENERNFLHYKQEIDVLFKHVSKKHVSIDRELSTIIQDFQHILEGARNFSLHIQNVQDILLSCMEKMSVLDEHLQTMMYKTEEFNPSPQNDEQSAHKELAGLPQDPLAPS